MPFKIDDEFDKVWAGKIPNNERLHEYIVWLRKEIRVAEVELDARLNPHKVTLQPEAVTMNLLPMKLEKLPVEKKRAPKWESTTTQWHLLPPKKKTPKNKKKKGK